MLKRILLITVMLMSSSAFAYPYFKFATKSAESFTGISDGSRINVKIFAEDSKLQRFLSSSIHEYFSKKGVVVTDESQVMLSITCMQDEINEPHSFTEVIPVASSGPNLPVLQTKSIEGMRTVQAVKCEGLISKKRALWNFLVQIPKEFLPEFQRHGITYVSKLFEYQGVGHVNLETGEVY